MKKLLFVLLFGCHLSVLAGEGLITVPSNHDVTTTADKLIAAVKAKGMKVFARIDHAAGASSVGASLKPTQLVIFGNPKLGSALMGCVRSVGIDLPMKALIYEDSDGKVMLSYNAPSYLKLRHAMPGCDKPVANATKALAGFAEAATR